MKKIVLVLALFIGINLHSNAQITNPAPYCDGAFDDNNGPPLFDWVNSVSLGTLSNYTGTAITNPHYVYYNNLTAPTLNAGNTYTINLDFNTTSNAGYGVWIDFNQDQIFDSLTEKIAGTTSGNPISGFSLSLSPSFTVPSTAVNGITRMRVRIVNDATYNANHLYVIAPCNASSSSVEVMNYGETEDYNLNIVNSSTGIKVLEGENSIDFNVENNIFKIKNGTNEIVAYHVYNSLGQEIISGKTKDNNLDISSIRAGLYLVKLSNEKGTVKTGKFFKK